MITEFLQKHNLTTPKLLKIVGLSLVGVIAALFIFSLLSIVIKPLNLAKNLKGVSPTASSYDTGYGLSMESAEIPSSFSLGGASGAPSLSARNIAPIMPPIPDERTTPGNDAEQFEVTEYSGRIETANLDSVCNTIADLKGRDYVIFENATKYDKNCNYYFKVKRDKVTEILAIVKNLQPKELIENTYTIKRQIEDFTSEIEILNNQKTSIDETLKLAISAYDEITGVATKSQNAEALAKIIDSKIRIIERLTQERININTQLDRLARAKADELDRLEYTYFRLNVIEKKYFDGQDLKDSWRAAIKKFVLDINKILQDITVNLISWLFIVLQYALYLFILVVLGKYGWRLIKRIWQS